MAGTTLQHASLLLGLSGNRPNATNHPASFFYATDTRELSVTDGTTWTVVNASSANPPVTALGIMTVAAGGSAQLAAHGLSGIPLATVEPLDDTLGARYRMAVDNTHITVLFDQAQAQDVRFYWWAVIF